MSMVAESSVVSTAKPHRVGAAVGKIDLKGKKIVAERGGRR